MQPSPSKRIESYIVPPGFFESATKDSTGAEIRYINVLSEMDPLLPLVQYALRSTTEREKYRYVLRFNEVPHEFVMSSNMTRAQLLELDEFIAKYQPKRQQEDETQNMHAGHFMLEEYFPDNTKFKPSRPKRDR